MDISIDKILSELVLKVARHFNLPPQEAVAVVAQSKLANELSSNGNIANKSLDQLSSELYEEIAKAQ